MDKKTMYGCVSCTGCKNPCNSKEIKAPRSKFRYAVLLNWSVIGSVVSVISAHVVGKSNWSVAGRVGVLTELIVLTFGFVLATITHLVSKGDN
jgi:hypothetical protein